MKVLPAVLASLLMTGLVAVGMLLMGANALVNHNVVPVSNSPQAVQPVSANASTSQQIQAYQQQVQQLQNLVNQYQNRDKQYQTQLNTAAQRLNQANQQISGYQNLLMALQQRGVIRISQDGQVTIPRGGFFDGDNN